MVVQGTTREEQDIQEALSPQVNYYDWEHTFAACIAPVPEHPAYRANFADYSRNRSSYIDSDDNAKARISFYMPKFHARISSDLAAMYKMSFSRFITYLCEIGLITFQIDYHDEYQTIQARRSDMVTKINSIKAKNLYMQLDKMTICLGSCNGARTPLVTHLAPTVPEWLRNAIADLAVYLNMTMTDTVYLCWCIGMKYSVDDERKCGIISGDVSDMMDQFGMELDMYSKFIGQIGVELDKQNGSKSGTPQLSETI